MISQTSKTLHLQPGSVSVEGELQSQEIDLDDDALVPATGLVNGLVMGSWPISSSARACRPVHHRWFIWLLEPK